MVHDAQCANATTLGCTCECGGRLHGEKRTGHHYSPGEIKEIERGPGPEDNPAKKEGPWEKWGLTKEQWARTDNQGEGVTLGDFLSRYPRSASVEGWSSDELDAQNAQGFAWEQGNGHRYGPVNRNYMGEGFFGPIAGSKDKKSGKTYTGHGMETE